MEVKISVIMPVYNASKYLCEAIESILKQTFKDFEFIIIDDGSTDNSKDIIEYYKSLDSRIKFFIQENSGISKTLNKGINMAKGKYIARMDADDIALPNRLSIQYNFMENNPEYVLIGSNANVISKEGDFLYKSDLKLTDELIRNQLPNNPFIHPSTFMKRESLILVGGYDEKIIHHVEDQILWNKLAEFGKLGNIEESLLSYRLVPSSVSNRTVKQCQKLSIIVNQSIIKGEFTQDSIESILALTAKKSHKNQLSNYYLSVGKVYLERQKKRSKAISYFSQSLWFNPLNFIALFNLVLAIFPFRVIDVWKENRYALNTKRVKNIK
jgi:glycosyltransferase involved in cell wall biosynthesis